MEISLIVAKVLGIYLVVSGLFLILRGKTLPHMLKDFFGHPAIVYLTGVILIYFPSMVLLQGGNDWSGGWRTLVTIIVWLVLLKGVAYILAPQMLEKLATKRLLKSVNLMGVITVAAGAYLFFLG